jgi:hypothetical protein
MLEHLSEDEVLPHLNHMKKMMVKGAFFQISLRPSVKDRPDEGYVLHRSVHRAPWWIDHLDTVFDTKVEVQPATRVTGKEHGLIAWTFAKPKEA